MLNSMLNAPHWHFSSKNFSSDILQKLVSSQVMYECFSRQQVKVLPSLSLSLAVPLCLSGLLHLPDSPLGPRDHASLRPLTGANEPKRKNKPDAWWARPLRLSVRLSDGCVGASGRRSVTVTEEQVHVSNGFRASFS